MDIIPAYKAKNKIRFVTAASLFDGHDASINIMRRILQSSGVEVIHLGHNRSVDEVVNCAIQEDVQGIAMTSYQGGHTEYFKYMYDLLQEKGAGNIKIFAGGGGVILPDEIAELENYGISKIYSPDDGRKMGLQGMINDMIEKCDRPYKTSLNGEINGKFAHNPEPLPQHLSELCNEVNKQNADVGIAVDPDVDRLCFVCEDGTLFGEEYTLVAVADYVLQNKKGNTVSNMSSTKALKDITLKNGGEYFSSAVGEVNVVSKMKEVKAVIGGEGNGGIIVPDLHYGRDALIGIALFLSHLAKEKKSARQLRNTYPDYFISKNKIELEKSIDIKKIFGEIKKKYKNNPINTEDGLKIEFENDWVHLRTSNTEPIIRIYAESNFETTANNIAKRIMKDISEVM